jgi:hypothetical protein
MVHFLGGEEANFRLADAVFACGCSFKSNMYAAVGDHGSHRNVTYSIRTLSSEKNYTKYSFSATCSRSMVWISKWKLVENSRVRWPTCQEQVGMNQPVKTSKTSLYSSPCAQAAYPLSGLSKPRLFGTCITVIWERRDLLSSSIRSRYSSPLKVPKL